MSHFIWGKASRVRMEGLDPRLIKVLDRAIELSEIDMTILEGVRSDVQCYINFGQGRTAAQCIAGGCPAKYAQPNKPKVTWLAHALSSNHRAKPGSKGKAVDVYPYPLSLVFGKSHQTYEPLFDKIAKAMFAASAELGIPIRWGANWDRDNMPRERGETDNPHFELI